MTCARTVGAVSTHAKLNATTPTAPPRIAMRPSTSAGEGWEVPTHADLGSEKNTNAPGLALSYRRSPRGITDPRVDPGPPPAWPLLAAVRCALLLHFGDRDRPGLTQGRQHAQHVVDHGRIRLDPRRLNAVGAELVQALEVLAQLGRNIVIERDLELVDDGLALREQLAGARQLFLDEAGLRAVQEPEDTVVQGDQNLAGTRGLDQNLFVAIDGRLEH